MIKNIGGGGGWGGGVVGGGGGGGGGGWGADFLTRININAILQFFSLLLVNISTRTGNTYNS